MKKINWRLTTAILLVVLLFAATAFVFWAGNAAPATDAALQDMSSDSQVYVSAENGWVVFHPADDLRPDTGFIFYPGGRVDFRAYAPVMKLIADQDYFVVLLPAPLNLAFFDVNAAARVQAEYPEIKNWFVGGHSLGGVAASLYAANHLELKGVVLWASYPADEALRKKNISVLSIYGTNDGLAGPDRIAASHALLPEDAKFVAIEGGNHAQFASYGPQAGDNDPDISAPDQWTQTANATVEFFGETLR